MDATNCTWCGLLARNGCEPEVCGHLGSSIAERAQDEKEAGQRLMDARKAEDAEAFDLDPDEYTDREDWS